MRGVVVGKREWENDGGGSQGNEGKEADLTSGQILTGGWERGGNEVREDGEGSRKAAAGHPNIVDSTTGQTLTSGQL